MRKATCLLALSIALTPPLSAQNVTAKLDSVLRAAEKKGFSGVVRIERDKSVLLNKGYGLANRATKKTFSPATIVQIGSNTKDFTAVAILQLKDRGLLSLSDTLGKFFAGAPADKRGITVQQVLEHSAGFPMYSGGDFAPTNRAQLIDSMMRTPLRFTPGSRKAYSNPGFSLLAAIIEHISGKTYDIYVRDAILKPLGLRRTGFLLPRFAPTDLAHGYFGTGKDDGTMLSKPHATDGPYWNLRGNGGMLSSVEEMHKFYKALFDGETLLRPATRNLRFPPDKPIGLAGSDGVAFFLYERFPGRGLEIIIASNNAAASAPGVRRELGKILGLPDPQGDGPAPVRTGGKNPSAKVSETISGLVAVLNTGTADQLKQFIEQNFANDPDSPSLSERTQRFLGLRERVGVLKVESMQVFDTGPVEVQVSSSSEKLNLKVFIDLESPWKIHGIQMLAEGG